MLAMYTDKDKLIVADGDEQRAFDIHSDRGEVLFIACGAGDEGAHVHYIAFENRMYVLSVSNDVLWQLGNNWLC